MSGRLDGKIAIVTGASSGLGLATARRFSEEGARVVAVDINAGIGDSGAALSVQVDITDPAGIAHLIERTKSLGSIDVLANFAGITSGASVLDMTLVQWERVLRVNLTGSFLVAQAVVPDMVAQQSGSIILITSGGYLGSPGHVNYGASKGGVVSLSRTLALELGRYNVRVNALAPGVTDTAMTNQYPGRSDWKSLESPLGRKGRPEELAAAALFLASDESSFITGQVFFANGGRCTGLAPA